MRELEKALGLFRKSKLRGDAAGVPEGGASPEAYDRMISALELMQTDSLSGEQQRRSGGTARGDSESRGAPDSDSGSGRDRERAAGSSGRGTGLAEELTRATDHPAMARAREDLASLYEAMER